MIERIKRIPANIVNYLNRPSLPVENIRESVTEGRNVEAYIKQEVSRRTSATVERRLNFQGLSDPFISSKEEEFKSSLRTEFLRLYEMHHWIFSCVDAIARNSAKVPFRLYELDKTGETQDRHGDEITDGPIWELFNEPNPFQTHYNFFYASMAYLLLAGNFFWEKDDPDMPTQLWLLRPDYMEVKADPKKLVGGYIYDPNASRISLDIEKVFHVKTFHPRSELYGMSQVSPAERSTIVDLYVMTYVQNYFKQGGSMRDYVTVPEELSEDAFQRMKQEFKTDLNGVYNTFVTKILDSGADIKSAGVDPDKTLLPEHKKWDRDEILSVFNVPPIIVGLPDNTHYNNGDVQQVIFWEQTVMPPNQLIQDAINKEFLWPIDIEGVFDYSDIAVLQPDKKKKAETGKILIESGQWTPNEVRVDLWKLDEKDGGDELQQPKQTMQFNMTSGGEPKETDKSNSKSKDKKPEKRDIVKELRKDTRTRAEIRAEFELWESTTAKPVTTAALKGFAKMSDKVASIAEKHLNRSVLVGKDMIAEALSALDKETISMMDDILKAEKKAAGTFGETNIRRMDPRIARGQIDAMKDEIDNRLNLLAKGANKSVRETLKERTKGRLEEILKQKKSAHEAAIELKDFFQGRRSVTGRRLDTHKWQRVIIRTENLKAGHVAKIQAMSLAGVKFKRWIATGPPDDRPTHTAVDNQVVAINDTFGNGLLFPGDPSAGPEDIINCRCDMVPEIGEE